MNDERLDEMLHSLDLPAASPGFTARTLSAAHSASRQRQLTRRNLVAASIALIGVAASLTGHRMQRVAEMEALRAEQRAIRGEIEQLKELTHEGSVLVPVAQSGDTEYVIDVRDLAKAVESFDEIRQATYTIDTERIH